MNWSLILSIAQIIVVVLFIGAVLIQQKGAGLGSAIGGGDAVFTARRGPEKAIYNATIALAALFIGLSIIGIFI